MQPEFDYQPEIEPLDPQFRIRAGQREFDIVINQDILQRDLWRITCQATDDREVKAGLWLLSQILQVEFGEGSVVKEIGGIGIMEVTTALGVTLQSSFIRLKINPEGVEKDVNIRLKKIASTTGQRIGSIADESLSGLIQLTLQQSWQHEKIHFLQLLGSDMEECVKVREEYEEKMMRRRRLVKRGRELGYLATILFCHQTQSLPSSLLLAACNHILWSFVQDDWGVAIYSNKPVEVEARESEKDINSQFSSPFEVIPV